MVTPYPNTGVVTDTDLSVNADVFPALPGQEFIQSKAPSFSTGVRQASNGREVRASFWDSPIWKFKVNYAVLRNRAALPETQKILAFFNSRRGKYGFFFFRDPTDDTVDAGEFLGTGDGTNRVFQFTRAVGRGTPYVTREPVRALWLAPTVLINGTPTTAFTIAPWGVLTFTSAPAASAAITWSGKFLYVCRFDQDEMSLVQLLKDLFSQDGLQFKSIKP